MPPPHKNRATVLFVNGTSRRMRACAGGEQLLPRLEKRASQNSRDAPWEPPKIKRRLIGEPICRRCGAQLQRLSTIWCSPNEDLRDKEFQGVVGGRNSERGRARVRALRLSAIRENGISNIRVGRRTQAYGP